MSSTSREIEVGLLCNKKIKGAIRPKMAIFKRGKWVCLVTKCFEHVIMSSKRLNSVGFENQIDNPIETVVMKVIQLKADRRIISHPTFQAHLLGLLGKTGLQILSILKNAEKCYIGCKILWNVLFSFCEPQRAELWLFLSFRETWGYQASLNKPFQGFWAFGIESY